MKFKLDDTFKHYWPPLPEEKRIILEKSILEEGLRDNLIVWKEKNILLDGHQRLGILTKHGIGYEDRITYLSFPDEVHAKHWVHVTQAARRGDAPQFLSICHVLEFEPIYREEAAARMLSGKGADGSGGRGHKKTLVPTGTEVSGRFTDQMARDAGCKAANSVYRVIYIRGHDAARFDALKELAERGEDYDNDGGPGRGKGNKEISIHLEWSKVKAMVDAKAAGVKLDPATLEKFTSSNTVRDFAETVSKFQAPVSVQKTAAEVIITNQTAADKNYIDDAVAHQMPKKKTERVKEFAAFIDECAKLAGTLRTKLKLLEQYKADLDGPFYQGKFSTTVLTNNLTLLKYQIEKITGKGKDNELKKLTA
jgi:hypothetical protein